MMNTDKKTALVSQILEYFKTNEETFNNCIEELDGYNGYLGDDRYYEMCDFDELHTGLTPSDLLLRVYYGYCEDYTDANGNHTSEFNPHDDYFRYNGYGNLVSSNYKDYSDHLDNYFIESLIDNRQYIYTIDDDPELCSLFDTLDEILRS